MVASSLKALNWQLTLVLLPLLALSPLLMVVLAPPRLLALRNALDLEVGIDLQAWDADLDTLSGMQTGAATALALLTSAEVAILDGALVTTAELNIIDGSTTATATTLAQADRMVVNDDGTMVQVALSDLVTFLEDGATSGFEVNGGTF
jgi:hypothetical protein